MREQREVYREYLDWICRRLKGLDMMEAKLLELRELASCAASQALSEEERGRVQERINALQAEVSVIDQETASVWRDSVAH